MTNTKPERVGSYRVRHHALGETFVLVENPVKNDEDVQAIQKAAERWKVDWTKIAADCDVIKLSEQYRGTCRCGRQFLSNTPKDRCEVCSTSVVYPTDRYRKREDQRLTAKN